MVISRLGIATVILSIALGSVSAAGARDARIPARPLIVDPRGDANGTDTADHPTPVSVDTGDILAGWMTADELTISTHWLLAASPRGAGIDLVMRAVDKQNPVEGERRFAGRCLWFAAEFPNADAGYEPYGYYFDGCSTPGPYAALTDSGEISMPMKVTVDVLEDGRAIVTATGARKPSPLLRPGKVLDHVDAQSALFRIYASGRAVWGRVSPLDSTAVGRNFRMP